MNRPAFAFKIGADPEFVILAGDKFVTANQALKRFLPKVKGVNVTLNPNQIGYNVGKHGEIGWDGAAMIGEIRPSPEKKPGLVVEHIGALFATAAKAMPFADFSPLSFVNPTGGHIHLEVPKTMTVEMARKRAKMVCALAAPLLAGEHPVSSKFRRDQKNYGLLDDVRIEKHFTHPDGTPGYTAEIRFPAAEWLISPKIAEATIAYMAIIWDGLLNSETFRKEAKKLCFANQKESLAITTIMGSAYGDMANFIASKIRRLVRTAPKYADYKDLVDFVMNSKAVLAEKEKYGWLINRGWKFADSPSQPNRREFLSEKLVKEKIGSKDEEMLDQYWPVSYNDDLNVSLFASALKERAAAFGWKPQREYFLFGMKKGVDALVAVSTDGFYAGAEFGVTLNDTLTRMTERAAEYSRKNTPKMDVRTGRLESPMSPVIIGIPRSMRSEKNTKEFLTLIMDIEEGSITPVPAVEGDAAKMVETAPEVEAMPIATGSIADAVKRVKKENDTLMRTAERPALTRQFLSNLRNWIGREGEWEMFQVGPTGMNNTVTYWNQQFPGFPAQTGDFIVHYPRDHSTIVNLGDEDDGAMEVLTRLFGVDQQHILTALQIGQRAIFNDYANPGIDGYHIGTAGVGRRDTEINRLLNNN